MVAVPHSSARRSKALELRVRPGSVHVVDYDASFWTAMERRFLLDRMPGESELGCILLDVRIPGMSGPELQERLSKLGSTLPIIFPIG